MYEDTMLLKYILKILKNVLVRLKNNLTRDSFKFLPIVN